MSVSNKRLFMQKLLARFTFNALYWTAHYCMDLNTKEYENAVNTLDDLRKLMTDD